MRIISRVYDTNNTMLNMIHTLTSHPLSRMPSRRPDLILVNNHAVRTHETMFVGLINTLYERHRLALAAPFRSQGFVES